MRSLASLALVLAVPAAAQEPAGPGPRGSSQLADGEVRYDRVGLAGRADLPGIRAQSPDLPAGSHAEVTSLDDGRTIVVEIAGGTPAGGTVLDLSPAATEALGVAAGRAAIRVRRLSPAPEDLAQLRAGTAPQRPAAPEALLVALRRKVPAGAKARPVPTPAAQKPAAASAPKRPVPSPTPSPSPKPRAPVAAPIARPTPAASPTVRGTFIVQVAALSSADRAAAVARAVGGSVLAGPPVWRVRLGPFANSATAARARDAAAAKGYGGGQILRLP